MQQTQNPHFCQRSKKSPYFCALLCVMVLMSFGLFDCWLFISAVLLPCCVIIAVLWGKVCFGSLSAKVSGFLCNFWKGSFAEVFG
jgi:hypothetical protein